MSYGLWVLEFWGYVIKWFLGYERVIKCD